MTTPAVCWRDLPLQVHRSCRCATCEPGSPRAETTLDAQVTSLLASAHSWLKASAGGPGDRGAPEPSHRGKADHLRAAAASMLGLPSEAAAALSDLVEAGLSPSQAVSALERASYHPVQVGPRVTLDLDTVPPALRSLLCWQIQQILPGVIRTLG